MEQALSYAGVVTFAMAGALAGVRKRFDIAGVVILAVVTAVGGGSVRDVVVGIIPPTALTDEALLWLPVATGLVVFATHHRLPTGRLLYVADTLSLGLFAALGAQRGVEVGFGLLGTVFVGAVSGIGGGIIRDVLSGVVPGVMYRSGDFYATAAAAGAACVFLLAPFSLPLALVVGAVVAAGLRAGSRLAGLHLPVPREPQ
ncbi:trimeric intracellular cation channel family protein [Egicoccus sp. AB-alg6-2]|uniref:trimeric intracellular cation channel family protein n=1 Tax=Egicoccus sp. AB-alg6-2 TaxID=3242692 RepID=UPI00359D0E1D